MNLIFGVLSLSAAFCLAVRFRPRSAEGRFLCLLTALSGVIGLLSGEASSFLMGLFMVLLQVTVGVCCYMRLQKEWCFRAKRRALALKARKDSLPEGVHRIAG